MDLIHQISSETNLQKAWIKAQFFATNHAPFFDITEYHEYSQYIKENFLILRNELLSGSYTPSPFRQIIVYKSNGEKRTLYFTSAKDNLVMMALLNVLGPIFELQMYDGSYGYRLAIGEEENKSISKRWQESYRQYIKRARGFLSFPSTAYYYITDLRNFYPNVNKELLLEKIAPKIDNNVYHILENIIYTKSLNNTGQLETISGIPTGTAIAPFLANIYLTEIDNLMASISIDYIRYVDDIMFSCEDLDTMNEAIGILGNSIQQLSLEQNVQKTTEEPIAIQDPGDLLEHTRKMHYDERFETVREISLEEQKEANQIFSEVFLAVESEGDIRKIASSSAALVVRFFERNELENLEKITLKLLETGIVKPETLRVVLGTQMRIAQKKGINFRFRDFLLNGHNIEKMTFLKLLPQFSELSEDNLITHILQAWAKSDDYLIRASVYDAIYQLRIESYFPDIIQYFSNENSEYVKSKIIRCLGANTFEDGELNVQRNLATETKPLILSAMFWVISDYWSNNSDLHGIYVGILVEIAKLQSFTETKSWCQRFLLENGRSEWRQIYEYVPDTIQSLLLECSLSQITVNQGSNLIISSIETTASHESSLEPSNTSRSQTVAEYIENYSKPHVEIPEFGYECSRRDYGHLSDRPDYVCQILECPDGRRATIEYIHINRILSNVNEFPTIDHWWQYLDRLQSRGIVNILARGEHTENTVYCVYEIPRELQTLSDAIRNRDQNSDEFDPFRITASIIQAMEATELEGFRFDGIVPHNILITAPGTPCKLLNLGFGLRSPNHNCTQDSCRHYQTKLELGRTTGLHYVGLSILELLLNTCPMEELHKIRSDSDPDSTLANLLGKLDIGPHMRSVLARLLQYEATWRYQTIENLKKDLQHITEYRQNRLLLDSALHDHFTLVDYILFRFAVALRMPKVANNESTTLEKTLYIVASVSRHIQYLDEKYKSIFREAVSNVTYWQMRKLGIPLRKINQLTPETRYLLRVSKAWIELVEELRRVISIPMYPLDKLLVLNALYIELSTHVQTIAFKSHYSKKLVDLSWCGDLDPSQTTEIAFQLGQQELSIRTMYSVPALKEALQITRYIEDGSQSFLSPVTTVNSLTAFLVLNALQYESQETNALNNLDITTKSEVDFEIFTSVVNRVASLENSIAGCINNYNNNTLLQTADWKMISEFIKSLSRIMPVKRRAAMLLDYDALQEQGVVRSRQPFRYKMTFQAPKVLTVGKMTKLGKKQRHISIDLMKVGNRHYLVSVLSRPNLFADALPFEQNRVFNILQVLRKYPNLTRAGIYFIALIILLGVQLSIIVAAPLSAVFPAIWEALYGFIDNILLPEKAKDI